MLYSIALPTPISISPQGSGYFSFSGFFFKITVCSGSKDLKLKQNEQSCRESELDWEVSTV